MKINEEVKKSSSDSPRSGTVILAVSAHGQDARAAGPLDTLISKVREQSQNVYENKGSAQKSTTTDPSFSKERSCRAPSSAEEGDRGWCDFAPFALGVKPGL